MRKAQCVAILVAFILSRESIGAQEFPTFGANPYRELLRTAYSQLERLVGLLTTSEIHFLADGGSDGGGGDGGGSSGDGSDGSGAAGAAGAAGAGATGAGTGDGSGGDGTGSSSDGDGSSSTGDSAGDSASDSDSASASDAASAAATSNTAAAAAAATSDDAAATDAATTTTTTATATTDNDAPSNDNNATDPDEDAPAVTVDLAPTAQQNDQVAVTPELAAIEDQATTDPRDGSGPAIPAGIGLASDAIVTTIPPGGFPPSGAPLENIEIHAVIVSAAQSPWDAIKRSPGVGTVTVVGGIIALGKTPIPGEITGGGAQPDWLRLIPDLRLLNGSMIPPVIPNIMDIRWLNCPIKIEDPNP